ncbi:MAG: hypothetical protein CMM16_01390 [Rhodospirillaceae bacterium]|nr:hypothetical protein [Rhodospirillaceae bacterium]
MHRLILLLPARFRIASGIDQTRLSSDFAFLCSESAPYEIYYVALHTLLYAKYVPTGPRLVK